MKETGFSRVSKNLIIRDIEKELKARDIFFIAQHPKISGLSLDQLRAKLRAVKSRYLVVKNSLAKIALKNSKITGCEDSFVGECGLIFSSDDPVAPSKVLTSFAKDHEGFRVQKGFVKGAWLHADQIKEMASLPSREVLLARAASGMKAPISRLVGVLSGTLRKLVTVLDAIAKKQD